MPVARFLVGFGSIVQLLLAVTTFIIAASKEDPSPLPACSSFLWGICAIASALAARPRSRGGRSGAIALNLILLLLVGAVAGFHAFKEDLAEPINAIALGVMILLLLACLANAIGLSIIARAPITVSPPPASARPRRSLAARILLTSGAVVGALILIVGLTAILAGVLEESSNRRHTSTKRRTPLAQEQRFEDLNFVYRSPGHPWTSLDPKTLNPDFALLLSRAKPQAMFTVIAESIGPGMLTTSGMVELAKANLRSASRSSTSGEPFPAVVAGLEGQRFSSIASVNGQEFAYVHWICEHNGFVYQLITWGTDASESGKRRVESNADQLFAGFELLDPERTAIPDGDGIQPFASPAFGYRVDLSGQGWSTWPDREENMPYAEFAAARGVAYIVVVPAALPAADGPLSHDAIARSLLDFAGVEYPGSAITSVRPLERDGLSGYDILVNQSVNSTDLTYRAHILRSPHSAYMVLAWTTAAGAVDVLEEAIAQVHFDPDAPAPAEQELTPAQRFTQGHFANNLGLFAYERKLYRRAADHFRDASRLQPQIPVFLQNAVDALEEISEHRDALTLLEAAQGRFPENTDLLSREAALRARLGDSQGAIAIYERILQAGHRDEHYLAQLITLLADDDQTQRAQQLLDQYTRPGTPRHRSLRAMLHRRDGDDDSAVAILREGLDQIPIDAASAGELFDLYYELDRYNEALEVAERLIAAGHDSAVVQYQKALAEIGLGWFPRAKASLETAQRQAPSDQQIRSALNYVVSQMGQGDTSAIRTPIDPVPIPPDLLQPRDSSIGAAESGGVYDYRIAAFDFAPGQRLRRTDYLRARVLDRRGVDRLGSYRFSFDPNRESLFVNSAVVLDEDGQPVWRGDLSNYYVLDDSQSEIASTDKILHIPIAALAPGRTLELVVTSERAAASERMPYTDLLMLSTFPVQRWGVVIRGDLQHITAAASPGFAQRSLEDATLFEILDQPAYRYEPLQDAPDSFLPSMRLGPAAGSWEDQARQYLKVISERLDVTDRVRALAERLTRSAANDAERIAAIVRSVQTDYRYHAIAFGPRAYIPTPVDQVITNRFGDCKDHSLLVHLLLKAAGIESHLALVRADSDIDSAIVSEDQFDHMIVHIPALGDHAFIDATDKHTDALLPVPLGLAGRTALVLDQGSPRLLTIPPYAPDSSRVTVHRTIHIEDLHDAHFEDHITISGYHARHLRARLAELDPADYPAAMQIDLAGSTRMQVLSAAAEHVFNPAEPIILRLTYRVYGCFHPIGDGLAGRLPAIYERPYLSFDPAPDRTTPFTLRYPARIDSRITVQLPDGMRLSTKTPALGQAQSQFGTVDARRDLDGSILTLTIGSSQLAGRWPASEYAHFWSHAEAALKLFEPQLIFESGQ
jgi:tetratricopeptide (TPR) repeat protein